jgi:pimeloyl-ACP methyl ester carboxylesterase
MSKFQLHQDASFDFETLRSLGTTRYHGADIQEILRLMPKIKAGDFDSWYNEWSALAKKVAASVDEHHLERYSPVTIRNTFFRASHYYFVAEFFLHGNWNDPRSQDAYEKWRKYFEIANAYLPIPGVYTKAAASFGEVPFYLFRTEQASSAAPKPLLIIGGGFDSNMEENMHFFGFDALERGYNVLIYDGPGHPSFLRDQHVGFIHDWEQVVTPIVDYVFAHSKDGLSYVDTEKIALLGMSLGGYLAARAAAFEPRLAAVICIDGVWSFFDCWYDVMPAELQDAWKAGDSSRFDEIFHQFGQPTASTTQRWMHDQGLLSFQEKSGFAWFQRLQKFTLDENIAARITMPAFIGDPEEDIFFKGQPPKVARAIGANATLFEFTENDAAAAHCSCGALVFQNQQIWEWFANVIKERE